MMLTNFLEEYLGISLDVIRTFSSNHIDDWINILKRLEIMMARPGRHHYCDAILSLLSRWDFWQMTKHPMAKGMTAFLPQFTEVVVEIFFSGKYL